MYYHLCSNSSAQPIRLSISTVLPSNLGIVGRNGEEKEAYWVFQDAIDRIGGT